MATNRESFFKYEPVLLFGYHEILVSGSGHVFLFFLLLLFMFNVYMQPDGPCG